MVARDEAQRAVVIGAGIGGLTAAAMLLRAGLPVTVLEAQNYPGGSAGTFFHQGYRFSAGATLAGGFRPGQPHARLGELLDLEWPVEPVDPAWIVHMPDGDSIGQPTDPAAWQAEREARLPGSEPFWRLQEKLAAIAWAQTARHFPWPPENARDLLALARSLRPAAVPALPYLNRTVADLLPAGSRRLRTFLYAQLLISAQTTAEYANALYGSAALDLPRRGVHHVTGGIGGLAQTLVQWIRDHGGEVLFRQAVTQIELQAGRAVAVQTNKGLRLPAPWLVANLTPWGLVRLLGEQAPAALSREISRRPATWGAFTLYLGLDADRLPADLSYHHQIIMDDERPLGEGNSVFVSLSADPRQAPPGHIAATLSTHTAVEPWWVLRRQTDEKHYDARRELYTERLLAAAERAIPGLRGGVRLCLPGTPLTFEYYTRRPSGMVGGFPQTSLFAARGPGTGIPNLKLVGDSVFPGQSTAGVTLSGMRVATDILQSVQRTRPALWPAVRRFAGAPDRLA
jgi:C-3',4' desaturase CrtD